MVEKSDSFSTFLKHLLIDCCSGDAGGVRQEEREVVLQLVAEAVYYTHTGNLFLVVKAYSIHRPIIHNREKRPIGPASISVSFGRTAGLATAA